MQKLIILLVMIFSFSISIANNPGSFDDAIALSKEQNKPLLIDVFTDW